MIVLYVLLALALLYLAASCVAAVFCLRLIISPAQYSEEHERDRDTRHGFAGALALWDNEWDRSPFSLESNGITLQGELIRNPAPAPGRTRVAVVCHGHTVNRISCIKYARIFLEEGFHVVVFDERHFGRSTGDICTLGQEESKDIANVAAYARSVFGQDCILCLQGESMGAAASLLALKYTAADFLVEDCPFCKTTTLAGDLVLRMAHMPALPTIPLACLLAKHRYRYDVAKVNPIEAVAAAEVPICFMHGTGDTLIACKHSEQMYAVCKNPLSELHLFPGSEHAHSIIDYPAEYTAVMKAFIRKCLAAL